MKRAFTLIELLVVIAIIAILAAILFPVFSHAKEAAKKTACLSNMKQIGLATQMYLNDHDGKYPQVKQFSAQPDMDDADGSIEDPDSGSVFAIIFPYTGGGHPISEDDLSNQKLYSCPSDAHPFDPMCRSTYFPGGPPVTSYLINAWFVFGLTESNVPHPADTIYFAERRTESAGSPAQDPYCDDIYHPWFNANNPVAPGDEMDAVTGAVSTNRHSLGSNFVFAEGHAGHKAWNQTFSLASGVNRHDPRN